VLGPDGFAPSPLPLINTHPREQPCCPPDLGIGMAVGGASRRGIEAKGPLN
jgi:hypothetical protein